MATDRDHLIRMATHREAITAEEVARVGIHSQQLSRLVAEGRFERLARGLYRLKERPPGQFIGLALASLAAPRGIVCLVSALSFHEVGTQVPHEIWIALDRRTRVPALQWPRLRVVRFGGESMTAGIERHRLEGVGVPIFGVAKTVADCFKYRNKVGLDVALEALREGWRAKRFTMEEIGRYARICRVEKVMRPYLEALVA